MNCAVGVILAISNDRLPIYFNGLEINPKAIIAIGRLCITSTILKILPVGIKFRKIPN